MRTIIPVFLLGLLIAPGSNNASSNGTSVSDASLQRAAGEITEASLRAHVKFLSSDLLEGRGPGTRGDKLAQAYIAAEFEAIGVEPGASGNKWIQPVPLVGVNSHAPKTVTVTHGSNKLVLKTFEDFIAVSGTQNEVAKIKNAEIVFVGYGIVAPEYQWDDFKDVDVKGKVVLVMNNDPESDPNLFAGKKRLWYGRWDYKYHQAALKGAAGVIIIHTTASASYPWQVVQTSWSGERFELAPDGSPQLEMEAWATEEASRKIATLGGKNLDDMRAAAEKRDFRPILLNTRLSVTIKNDVKKTQSGNVIGVIEGSDKKLASEAVVFTAHHDHLGIKSDAKPGEDAIYNGALDNSTGVAALIAIAKAFKALPHPPKRKVYFVAVAAEEQGLLGSEFFTKNPPLPPGKIAANINFDGLGIFGRTRDVQVVGLGKSSLDDEIKKLAAQKGRIVLPEEFPEHGVFYRSDQFNFAKIGVPAIYADNGTDVIGKPSGWGREQFEKYIKNDYHQPSDEYSDKWDLSGAVEDVQLIFQLGVNVANAAQMPTWNKGDEFEAVRLKALSDAAK